MSVITSAHHLDEALPGLPITGHPLTPELPDGPLAGRLLALYGEVAERVAAAVTAGELVTVAAGDCMTSLGVLAGLGRAGISPGIVWLDAHGDFNTPATTRSGYIGGMPVAAAVGHDVLGLGSGLGLAPLAEERVLLAGVRDLDEAEGAALRASAVRRTSVAELTRATLPEGPLYLHIDIDVIDADEAGDVLFPVGSGPSVAEVAAAIARVLATGRVAAVGLACTWTGEALCAPPARELIARLGLPGEDAVRSTPPACAPTR
jgi:arginase family enzyme